MATTPALGNGPVEFTDSTGKQVSIPLSALSFESGNPKVNTPFDNLPAIDLAILNKLLRYLSSQLLIVPVVTPSPKPAMLITAADPGAAGNNIEIKIKVTPDSTLDPTKAKFDVTLTETDTYTGLSAATIRATLGYGRDAGKQPGLVRVKAVNDPAGVPDSTVRNYTLTGGGLGTRANVEIKDNTHTVITLEAKKEGSEGGLTTVTISNVGAINKTFDLKAEWTNKVIGVTLGTVQSLAALSYEIAVSPPPSGVFSVPADTGSASIKLSGGAEGASPSAASATVFAGQ